MTDLRSELSRYCASIGQDRLLVQGAGGNASWKEDGTLWIKASGTWLAEATEKDIFLPVDLLALQSAMAAGDFSAKPVALTKTALRPSIETLFHALLPHKIVLHTHAIAPLARLVRQSARAEIEVLIGSAYRWVFVDYFKPGAELAAAIHDGLQKVSDVQIIFMQNHGLVVGGNTVAEVAEVMADVIERLSCDALYDVYSGSDVASKATPVPGYRPAQDVELQTLMFCPALADRIARDWALYPDHVVFLGAAPVWDTHEAAEIAILKPPYLFSKEHGVLEADDVGPGARAQMLCYLDVLLRQPEEEVLTQLNIEQIDVLLDWDAEKFRQSIAPIAADKSDVTKA
jgi:rhamnose utilization protein RhaD (predicted bifunctional aldolase and dehydrogenase)